MAEYSLFWDGSTVGDCGPYDDSDLCDSFFRALFNGTGNQGVLKGWLNALAVTDGGGLNAAVATGGALCYGGFFESDAAETVALPNNSTVVVIVSRVWATQTIRLSHDGGAGLTQTPGVRYDIPLATVTTLAGIITLIVDARDYCVFSTIPGDLSVNTTHIQDNAVTTDKLINQTRWVTRGGGECYADATVPATRDTVGGYCEYPYHDTWQFSHGVADSMWLTFRVPTDFTGANVAIYFWVRDMSWSWSGDDVRLAFSAWKAAASGVLANVTGAVTYHVPDIGTNTNQSYSRVSMGNIAVSAGDIVHLEAYRDGAAGADVMLYECNILMVEATYTADS